MKIRPLQLPTVNAYGFIQSVAINNSTNVDIVIRLENISQKDKELIRKLLGHYVEIETDTGD